MLNSAISAAPAANAENALATVIPNPMAAGQRRRHHIAIKAAKPSVESTKSSRSECRSSDSLYTNTPTPMAIRNMITSTIQSRAVRLAPGS